MADLATVDNREPPRINDPASSVAEALIRKRRRDRLVAWLQLLPGSTFFIAFFLVPLLGLLVMSFFRLVDFEPVADFTLSNYAEVLTSNVHARLALRTVQAATIVTAIVLLISFPFAYTLNFVFRKHRQLLFFLVLVSLFGGYIVRIYAWRSILGNQGVINQGLMALSIVDEPVRELLNSMYAVGASLVNFLIPLGVLPIYAAMQNVSPGIAEAARDLGASRMRAARQIVLPLSMRGVRAAAAFVFIATLGEWVTPRLLGGTKDSSDRQPDRVLLRGLAGMARRRRPRHHADRRDGSRRVRDHVPDEAVGEMTATTASAPSPGGWRRGLAKLRRQPVASAGFVGVVLIYLFAPLIVMVAFSFNSSPPAQLPLRRSLAAMVRGDLHRHPGTPGLPAKPASRGGDSRDHRGAGTLGWRWES